MSIAHDPPKPGVPCGPRAFFGNLAPDRDFLLRACRSELRYRSDQVHYHGQAISLWDSYGLAGYELRTGAFSEDARGRWYLNVTVDVARQAPSPGTGAIGTGARPAPADLDKCFLDG